MLVRFHMDATVLDAGRRVARHICFDNRRVLNHRVLTDLDIDAASDRFDSICDRTRTSDVRGDGGVVQEQLAASNEYGAATVAAGVNDRLFGNLNAAEITEGLAVDVWSLGQGPCQNFAWRCNARQIDLPAGG